MICGSAPSGPAYRDKAGGNPQGKAHLESTFNLWDNEAGLRSRPDPGRRYDSKAPLELAGRTREAEALLRTGRHLNPFERARLKLPFLNYEQARLVCTDIWNRLANRTDHQLEAFNVVGEWREKEYQDWRLEAELGSLPPERRTDGKIIWRNPPRKESPNERWDRLVADLGPNPFIQLHPGAIRRLYDEHKLRPIENFEIRFDFDKDTHIYRIANVQHCPIQFNPSLTAKKDHPLNNGNTVLCYFDPQDLSFIHLTDGQGAYLGSIPRTRGARRTDKAALRAEYDRKRDQLHQLQDVVSSRLPEQIEQRLADLDSNIQLLETAAQNAGALDVGPTSPTCPTSPTQTEPEISQAISAHALREQVKSRQAAAEAERIGAAPRSLAAVLAGHDARNSNP
jgi:hypothetical protein